MVSFRTRLQQSFTFQGDQLRDAIFEKQRACINDILPLILPTVLRFLYSARFNNTAIRNLSHSTAELFVTI